MIESYELLCIIPVELSEDIAKVTAKIETLITKEGGLISDSQSLGKKRLAYPIKKARQGVYHLVLFKLDTLKLKDLEPRFRLLPEILRYILLKQEPVKKMIRKPRDITKMKKEAPKLKPMLGEKKESKILEKGKVSIEELDQKIDEILKDDIVK